MFYRLILSLGLLTPFLLGNVGMHALSDIGVANCVDQNSSVEYSSRQYCLSKCRHCHSHSHNQPEEHSDRNQSEKEPHDPEHCSLCHHFSLATKVVSLFTLSLLPELIAPVHVAELTTPSSRTVTLFLPRGPPAV
ncbi:hypothetical protein Pla110_41990 [Polystyrenella longa]|uniref:DUF2946 domain-containing protein n=1 Tax=Polystyrenella longa TaxID=2528007 RepID=A0A518CT85_9PLAN|nr:hypothetical protein Pla110_41990 [Polystyrenella longa]